MRLFLTGALIAAVFGPLAAAAEDVGPCNEDYYFTCTEDGECTCKPLQPIDDNFVSSSSLLPGSTLASEGGNWFAA